MINKLKELKEKYNAIGLKAEFEDEGLSFDDALRLKTMSDKEGLDFGIKIGGQGAVSDIKSAKRLCAKAIIAPMTESVYGFQKFVKSIKTVYKEELPNLYINIETKCGLSSLDDILNCDESRYLQGVVLGRSDMIRSFNLECSVNDERILDIAKHISTKSREHKKKFIIGGGIFQDSLRFLSDLGEENFDYFETRKIIFDAKSIKNKNMEKGIILALEFEIEWLKTLQNPLEAEILRIKKLEEEIKKIPASST